MNQMTTECAYCSRDVTAVDLTPPALHDDLAWENLATEHALGCEWVATRAHRFDDKEAAYQRYLIQFCGNRTDATEYESQALSIGDEFIPKHVRDVRDRKVPVDRDYWEWLIDQASDLND